MPIQLSYLGYPGPTYLKCIDGWIGDKELFSTLSKEEQAAHPLDIYRWWIHGIRSWKNTNHHRTYAETFRFGCFNHARKLTNPTIELFCKVLKSAHNQTIFEKHQFS